MFQLPGLDLQVLGYFESPTVSVFEKNGLRKNGARDLFFLGEEVVCVCVFAMGNTEVKTKEVARARCLGCFLMKSQNFI